MKTVEQETPKGDAPLNEIQTSEAVPSPRIKFLIPQELKQIKGGKTLQFAYDIQ